VKFTLEQIMKEQRGSRYRPLLLSLTSALDAAGLSTPRPDRFTHCRGGWMGPKAGLKVCGNPPPYPPGFNPRTVQFVASRYTDWNIPPHNVDTECFFNRSPEQGSSYGYPGSCTIFKQLSCRTKWDNRRKIYINVSQTLWDRGPVNSFFIRRGHGPNKFTRKYLSTFFKFIH
jgi:hypothetical protein